VSYRAAVRFFGGRDPDTASPLRTPVRPGHWAKPAGGTGASHKVFAVEGAASARRSGVQVAKFWCGATALRSGLRLAGRDPCRECLRVFIRIGATEKWRGVT
jgi:hypothetical protein